MSGANNLGIDYTSDFDLLYIYSGQRFVDITIRQFLPQCWKSTIMLNVFGCGFTVSFHWNSNPFQA